MLVIWARGAVQMNSYLGKFQNDSFQSLLINLFQQQTMKMIKFNSVPPTSERSVPTMRKTIVRITFLCLLGHYVVFMCVRWTVLCFGLHSLLTIPLHRLKVRQSEPNYSSIQTSPSFSAQQWKLSIMRNRESLRNLL